jgi:hypothetical protein
MVTPCPVPKSELPLAGATKPKLALCKVAIFLAARVWWRLRPTAAGFRARVGAKLASQFAGSFRFCFANVTGNSVTWPWVNLMLQFSDERGPAGVSITYGMTRSLVIATRLTGFRTSQTLPGARCSTNFTSPTYCASLSPAPTLIKRADPGR